VSPARRRVRGASLAKPQLICAFSFQIIIAAGVIGCCVGVVEGVRWAWAKLQQWYDGWAVRKRRKRAAIKNLAVLPPDFSATLRYLQAKNMKRFLAPTNNHLLYGMSNSFLLEIDDPQLMVYSDNTYCQVPDYVWDRIDRNRPVPERPPWANRL